MTILKLVIKTKCPNKWTQLTMVLIYSPLIVEKTNQENAQNLQIIKTYIFLKKNQGNYNKLKKR